MKLARDGREYCHWPVKTLDTLTNFEVQLTAGGDWLTAEYITDPTVLVDVLDDDDQAAGYSTAVRLLVYGPNFTDTTLGVPVATTCQPRIRCTDTPEVVVRQGGWVILV